MLVWCHRSSPGGLQEPALPLALGLASAQSGNRRSPPPPSMATWIPLPSALPGSTVRCIPAPRPLGSWRRSLLTHRRAVARPPCRAAMAPQVNLRIGKPGGLPWGPPAPKFGGGVIGGDCVVSAMIEQNLTLFDAKKAQDARSALTIWTSQGDSLKRFTVGIAASLNPFSFNLLVCGPCAAAAD